MAKTISIFNQKGGVGKSTTASNLMAELTRSGYKVLGVDIDAQGHLSKFCGIDTEGKNTIKELLANEATFAETVQHAKYGDVLPCDRYLQSFLKAFDDDINNIFKLQKMVVEQGGNYDFIIFDCPPNANRITFSALMASNYVIVPTEAEYFSMDGVAEISRTISSVKEQLNPKLSVLGVLIVKYQPRRSITKQFENVMAQLADNYLHCKLFDTKICYAVAVPTSQAAKQSVVEYDKKSKAAEGYVAFAKEVVARVKENG